MTTIMALVSMMRNYGSTSTTSPRSFAGETASFEEEQTDTSPAGPAAAEDNMVKKMQYHRQQSYDRHHRGGKSSKTGFMVVPAAYSVLLMSVVMAVTVSALIQPIHANPTCILNCAQCVKIYGDFFDGHKCAKVCMDSQSNKFESFVDCADPTTIARFLKSF